MSGDQELMFAASCDPSEVLAALSSRYTVVAEPGRSLRWVCLDTADWRLHRAGMTLQDCRSGRSGGELVLNAATGERLTGPSRAGSWPRRVDGLPPAAVRDRIARVIGVRALLPLAEVDAHSVPLRLLDRESKTRVRVRVDQQRLAGARRLSLPLRVVVSSMRGYERDAQRCAALLAASMPAHDSTATPVSVALRTAGHTPHQGPAALALDPDAPVIVSLARVLLQSMGAVDAARGGVIEDIDPEFLHDLRIAVRTTRSILSLAGELLPGGAAARFAAEFGWLGRLTSPVRDLDVYLLELDGQGSVNVDGLADLSPLRQYVHGRRRTAFRLLRDGLVSRRGSVLSEAWRAALTPMVDVPMPGRGTGVVAAELAWRAYRRLERAAAPVGSLTPADDLHGLRRRGKRMRYLLDGFSSVFAPKPLAAVSADLKKLQDCLGDIQDSDVQRAFLTEVAARLAARGAPADTLLAMGALRDRIAGREAEARLALGPRVAQLPQSATRTNVLALRAASS